MLIPNSYPLKTHWRNERPEYLLCRSLASQDSCTQTKYLLYFILVLVYYPGLKSLSCILAFVWHWINIFIRTHAFLQSNPVLFGSHKVLGNTLWDPRETLCKRFSRALAFYWPLTRGVTIHKSHDLVRTSVFKSRFGMFFGTAVFIILFLLNNFILIWFIKWLNCTKQMPYTN